MVLVCAVTYAFQCGCFIVGTEDEKHAAGECERCKDAVAFAPEQKYKQGVLYDNRIAHFVRLIP